jgi:hypothetical protein
LEIAVVTNESVATLLLVSPGACVVAVVPLGSAVDAPPPMTFQENVPAALFAEH